MNDRPRVAVVDHGAGNLVSIAQALERVGADPEVVTGPEGLEGADGIVLPGVGSTGAVMAGIDGAGFGEELRNPRVPLLGICVGMQVMFEGSDEDDAVCLGLIGGRVERLTSAPTLPHIGWNELDVVPDRDLFAGLAAPVVYFAHSFAPVPADASMIAATAVHGDRFVAAVADGLVTGVQFHPERSGTTGLRILARFVDRTRVTADAP